MANPEHVSWLKEGSEGWNSRMRRKRFRPELSGAILRSFNLHRFDLRGANLFGADLSDSVLSEALLDGSTLVSAILSDADLLEASVGWFNTNPDPKNQFTCLLNVTGLTQRQLDLTLGDTSTIIPESLLVPKHWDEIELPDHHPLNKRRRTFIESSSNDDGKALSKNFQIQREAILLSSASLIEQVIGFRETVRQNNSFRATNPDKHDKVVGFLNDLVGLLEGLPAAVPDDHMNLDENSEVRAKSWSDRFLSSAVPGFQKYLAPEALGEIAPPAAIILGFGGFGALITLGSPIGFGIGSVAGKWLTGEMKSSSAANEIEKITNSTTSDTE